MFQAAAFTDDNHDTDDQVLSLRIEDPCCLRHFHKFYKSFYQVRKF